jgi:hypothetical protein
MLLKILDKKTGLEKTIEKAKRLDIVFIKCNKCNKEIVKKYRFEKDFSLCSDCLYKKTNLKKYGQEHPQRLLLIKNRTVNTCLEKYGKKAITQTDLFKEKAKIIWNKKYNADNPNKSKLVRDKIEKTNLEKYGVKCNSQLKSDRDHFKQTCIEKYGTDNYAKTKEYKEKCYVTKKKNNSFHTSKPEEEVFEFLKQKFINVLRQYKDARYPFSCDFYIPQKDLFIEYQGSWLHGKKPFKKNKSNLEKLNKWKSKNTKYYEQAIKTWIVRDVNKRNIAKKNNLNYLEFFNKKELFSYFN